MDNSGSIWSEIEEQQLINEYTTNNLNIDEIAEIHKRHPGGIAARLVKLGIINERKQARRRIIESEKEEPKGLRIKELEEKLRIKELEEKVKILESKLIILEDKIDKLQLTSLD
jgi:hypothetical protein